MDHCQFCGGFVLQIKRGGCGGNGSFHRCTQCGRVFEQISGGIVGTSGGETYKPLDVMEVAMKLGKLLSVHEWLKQLSEENNVRFGSRGKES